MVDEKQPTDAHEVQDETTPSETAPEQQVQDSTSDTTDTATNEGAASDQTEPTDQTGETGSDSVLDSTEAASDTVASEAATQPVAEEVTPTLTPEEFAQRQEEERARREEDRKRKAEELEARNAAFVELTKIAEEKRAFDVKILERVKGGLRGEFNGLRVFLPASHFGVRKNVAEEELVASVGTTVSVKVHELQTDETGFKSAVVTRRELLLNEYWSALEVGAVHEGVVASVTTFGAFVNIGGVEGLVHVSRLSKSRIDKPADVVKKGDKLTVTITEIDKENKKLSLSHKEHEADPWQGLADSHPVGTRTKGIVKRITDFGAYVQIAPRIEGLLRVSELSWTQRIKHPSDVLTIDSEIDVEVLSVNEAKHQIALGYKQTQDNPWLTIANEIEVGTSLEGTVQNVAAQGVVVRVKDVFDGFMPKSKILSVGRNQKIDIAVGDNVECVVVDLDPGAASLILAMKNEDGSPVSHSPAEHNDNRRGERRDSKREQNSNNAAQSDTSAGVTIGDLLRDADKSKLNG